VARQAALAKDHRTAAKLLFRAASLIQGNAEEETLLAQSIAEDDQFLPARIRRAELLLQNNPQEALADLEVALAAPISDPDAPAADVRMELTRKAALLALKIGQTEAARRYLDQCLRCWPEDLEIQSQLVKLHRQAGAKEQLFELLMRLWPRLEGPDRGEACQEAADLALQLGRPDEAAAMLRRLLEAKPADVWATKELLRILPQTGASEDNERELQSLFSTLVEATSGAERSGFLSQRAGSYRRVGDLEKAKRDLTEAAMDHNPEGRIFEELADLARQMGDERGEVEAWAEGAQKHLSIAEKAIPRLIVLARSRLDRGDLESARRGFSIAAEFASALRSLSWPRRCAWRAG
jgi:tetratricopeptide (TPR) repeat protein